MRWTQRNPKGIVYRQLDQAKRPAANTIPTHLREVSDAAFTKEEETGHSMRGACYVRCVGTEMADLLKTSPGHLLDAIARAQRRVTRATFTSDSQGVCDTVDEGFLLLQTFG